MGIHEPTGSVRVYGAMSTIRNPGNSIRPPGLSFRLTIFFLLSLFLPGALASEDSEPEALTPESRITRVHVFDGQALILRRVRVNLPQGRVRVAFPDLPEKLLDQTVRLRLEGASDLRLVDLRVETIVEKEFRSEEALKAEKELKAAEQELREVTALYLAQMEQKKAVSSVELKPDEGQKPIISIERWKAIFGFVDSSLDTINGRLNSLLGRIDAARRRLEIALTVAERYKSQKETKRKLVVVDLESTRPAEYGLALEYGVNDAGWYPHYRLTVDSRSSRPSVRLTTAAYIYNETGEDWNEAKVSLSTADLTNPSRLPDLKKWTIASVIRPERERMARKDGPASSGTSDMMDTEEEADEYLSAQSNERESAPPAEPVASHKPVPQKKQEKIIQQQQRMKQSVDDVRGYYNRNLADVKEDLADQKAKEARDLMEEFRESVNKQEIYYDNRDFSNARTYSSRTLDIIKRLSPSEKARFSREIQQAEKIRSWSYEMEQSRRLKTNLTAPGKQVPGDFSVDAPLAISMQSDGVLRSIYLAEGNYSAALSYEVSLNRSPGAYLTAAVEYNGTRTLLAGPVEVYYGEDFGGTSHHPMVAPREKYNLNLGRDPDVEIIREDRQYETSEGLFGGKRAVRYETTFTVHNRRSYEVDMELYGAVPRSADDRISIANVELSPEPVKKEENGIMHFALKLKSNDRVRVRMSYQLIHDRDVLPVMRARGGSR